MSEKKSVWAPELYSKFITERLRPALDLLRSLPIVSPKIVYDIGCGLGNITDVLSNYWSSAQVVGVDNSDDMIRFCEENYPNVFFQKADIVTWIPQNSPDIIFSNSLFHLVNGHEEVIKNLLRRLNKQGIFAIQMPVAFDSPWYQLMVETIELGMLQGLITYNGKLLKEIKANIVKSPDFYYSFFSPDVEYLNIWETEYFMVLGGENAIFEWLQGAGLQPVLGKIPVEEHSWILDNFKRQIRAFYPTNGGKTIFPFKRLFLVLRKGI